MPIIQAVDRALKILDLFDEYETELKITDISERMNLHKSTIHSLLKTLQIHGYIDQNLENGKYKLGLKLFERGNLVVYGLDLRSTARKYLIDLSIKTGQTVHLVILDGREGVYIDKVEGTSGIIAYSRIGRRIPIHCSAVGKVLVAFLPEIELRELLMNYVFQKQTEQTITTVDDFLRELENVRTKDYAIDNQENEPGVRCIAVPIRNYSGQVVAAMSMSTPNYNVDNGQSDELLEQLQNTAQLVSRQLGYGKYMRA